MKLRSLQWCATFVVNAHHWYRITKNYKSPQIISVWWELTMLPFSLVPEPFIERKVKEKEKTNKITMNTKTFWMPSFWIIYWFQSSYHSQINPKTIFRQMNFQHRQFTNKFSCINRILFWILRFGHTRTYTHKIIDQIQFSYLIDMYISNADIIYKISSINMNLIHVNGCFLISIRVSR